MNENCNVWDYKVKFILWKGGGWSQKEKRKPTDCPGEVHSDEKESCLHLCLHLCASLHPRFYAGHRTRYKFRTESFWDPLFAARAGASPKATGTSEWSTRTQCCMRAYSTPHAGQRHGCLGLAVHPITVHRGRPDILFLVLNLDKTESWIRSEKIWIPPNIYVNFTFQPLGPQLFAKRGDCAKLPVSPF